MGSVTAGSVPAGCDEPDAGEPIDGVEAASSSLEQPATSAPTPQIVNTVR